LLRGVCSNRWSSEERLDGKTVIITGANTGIGKETARDLARRGARIVMACRDLERAEEARTDILEDTGNENVVIRKLDLSDTKSIRVFAELINKEEKQVNILVNNAGVMMCPYSKTVDGFEMQLGVNHLGHLLLTYLLLDLIKRSAPARIVVVASVAHTWTGIRLDDINSERSYDTMKAYGQSKLANVLFARSLAKLLQVDYQGTGVSVFSLHPGVVQSDLWRHQHQCIQVAVKIFRVFTKTTLEGAQTTIYCAVEPGLDSQSGGYFSDCAPARCSRAASDEDLAQKLWEISCNMLGITWQ
uniref:Si:dkey-94e7.2 n=1 Tax=Gasterosteus aculeatus TaxID=69293 RepID=G3ND05_GASAC